MQYRSTQLLQTSIDNNHYNESELIKLTVPLHLPYITSQSTFERVEGEINVNGTMYKYVKRKIEEGKLILLCLPNKHKMMLEVAKDNFFSNTSNFHQNTSSSGGAKANATTSKNTSFEAVLHCHNIATILLPHSLQIKHFYRTHRLTNTITLPQEQPPDFCKKAIFMGRA